MLRSRMDVVFASPASSIEPSHPAHEKAGHVMAGVGGFWRASPEPYHPAAALSYPVWLLKTLHLASL